MTPATLNRLEELGAYTAAGLALSPEGKAEVKALLEAEREAAAQAVEDLSELEANLADTEELHAITLDTLVLAMTAFIKAKTEHADVDDRYTSIRSTARAKGLPIAPVQNFAHLVSSDYAMKKLRDDFVLACTYRA